MQGQALSSPHYVNTERDYETDDTRQLCLRAAQQQTGASPVTAVAIGSGSAALVFKWAKSAY